MHSLGIGRGQPGEVAGDGAPEGDSVDGVPAADVVGDRLSGAHAGHEDEQVHRGIAIPGTATVGDRVARHADRVAIVEERAVDDDPVLARRVDDVVNDVDGKPRADDVDAVAVDATHTR